MAFMLASYRRGERCKSKINGRVALPPICRHAAEPPSKSSLHYIRMTIGVDRTVRLPTSGVVTAMKLLGKKQRRRHAWRRGLNDHASPIECGAN